MTYDRKSWLSCRKRVHEIVEVGGADDKASRAYDFLSTLVVLINLVSTVLYTFDSMEANHGRLLLVIEEISVAFFALDYMLRLFSAHFLYPSLSERHALRRYFFSFSGLVDLFSFLPHYLPFFFPAGVAAFRIFRVIRIFRLFRINAYYDSLNVITEVISSKWQQLFSSVFIILVLMLSSSLCMYSLEHDAQPEVFSNAFSGIWWSVSTLLTVGYGDIYPITTMGKIFSIIITFLGVGMVAIPTGIISAGFVDQYSRLTRMSEYGQEEDVHFIKILLDKDDRWVGTAIKDLGLPHGVIVAVIRRGHETIVPRGNVVLKSNDYVVLGAESVKDDSHIDLKEIALLKHHPWNGVRIRDLDISRQSIIVMVKRSGKALIPKGSMTLLEGDHVVLYTQMHLSNPEIIQL